MRVLGFLLRKEFLQIRRDPTILRMLFLMPVIQLLLLANAATFEVSESRLYLVDHDRSPASRELADRFRASGRFVPVSGSGSHAAADRAMLARDVDIILTIPRGFDRDLVRGTPASVQLVLNAEDGAAAAVTQSYAGEIIRRYAAERVATGVTLKPPSARIEVQRRGWYDAELRYRDFMVPGILVQLVTMIGTLLTAMNIVREKEAGTLDQLNVTPVGRATFIASKLLPLWSLALLVLGIGLAVSRLAFDVPMRGSLALVFAAAAIYLVGALGVGLWVSTIAETQQQAMFITFSILMVYLLMSGLFTPISAMPGWAQWIATANPVTHFISLMRMVLLKGAGIGDVSPQLGALAAISVLVMALAIGRYRKQVV